MKLKVSSFLFITLLCSFHSLRAQSLQGTLSSVFRLDEPSEGGKLTLARITDSTPASFIEIDTEKDQGPDLVCGLISNALSQCQSCQDALGVSTLMVPYPELPDAFLLNGGRLGVVHGIGQWSLAGTDLGLGIPRPIDSLTANLEEGVWRLRWVNGETNYTGFSIFNYGVQIGAIKDGTSTSFDAVMPAHAIPADLAGSFAVLPVRNYTPSNCCVIDLAAQPETGQITPFAYPFLSGVAPGFKPSTRLGECTLAEGRIPEIKPGLHPPSRSGDMFYQRMLGQGMFRLGLKRSFPGITKPSRIRMRVEEVFAESPEQAAFIVLLHGFRSGIEASATLGEFSLSSLSIGQVIDLAYDISIFDGNVSHVEFLLTNSSGGKVSFGFNSFGFFDDFGS